MTVNTRFQLVPELETARLEKLAHPPITCTSMSPAEPFKKQIAISSFQISMTQVLQKKGATESLAGSVVTGHGKWFEAKRGDLVWI